MRTHGTLNDHYAGSCASGVYARHHRYFGADLSLPFLALNQLFEALFRQM